ncbi:MAG: ribosome silencing factor [Opitutales bacterium]|nr:ribosome silencing factor [Opitutales bacterium]MCH8539276.1 ribosome silencing factor [Opitutales bacterium]
MVHQNEDSWKTLQVCCQALDDKKAGDLKILRVQEVSSVTDYFVIATGTSAPHLRALTEELKSSLKEAGVRTLGSENDTESGWNVVDAFEVIVHLFLPEVREQYRLDTLWKDGELIDPQKLIPDYVPEG